MQYQGLEAAKRPFLDLKSMMEIWKKRDPARSMDSLKLEGFKGIFHGNPGTGKHSQPIFLNSLVNVSAVWRNDGSCSDKR